MMRPTATQATNVALAVTVAGTLLLATQQAAPALTGHTSVNIDNPARASHPVTLAVTAPGGDGEPVTFPVTFLPGHHGQPCRVLTVPQNARWLAQDALTAWRGGCRPASYRLDAGGVPVMPTE